MESRSAIHHGQKYILGIDKSNKHVRLRHDAPALGLETLPIKCVHLGKDPRIN